VVDGIRGASENGRPGGFLCMTAGCGEEGLFRYCTCLEKISERGVDGRLFDAFWGAKHMKNSKNNGFCG
jgi:hypothetical protein